jgi:hypothetical protein
MAQAKSPLIVVLSVLVRFAGIMKIDDKLDISKLICQ